MSGRRKEKAGNGELRGIVGETTETRYFWKCHNRIYVFILCQNQRQGRKIH